MSIDTEVLGNPFLYSLLEQRNSRFDRWKKYTYRRSIEKSVAAFGNFGKETYERASEAWNKKISLRILLHEREREKLDRWLYNTSPSLITVTDQRPDGLNLPCKRGLLQGSKNLRRLEIRRGRERVWLNEFSFPFSIRSGDWLGQRKAG